MGKQEQGMSIALQVEKTSKRGGRIIHEKELMLPPPVVPSPPVQQPKDEPTITEIMKAPSKVILLRVSTISKIPRHSKNNLLISKRFQNMVGPGDVDNDLEPEVKDECNRKYGEVVSVVINELTNVIPEEAVRIFVEFKRIESAIKGKIILPKISCCIHCIQIAYQCETLCSCCRLKWSFLWWSSSQSWILLLR